MVGATFDACEFGLKISICQDPTFDSAKGFKGYQDGMGGLFTQENALFYGDDLRGETFAVFFAV